MSWNVTVSGHRHDLATDHARQADEALVVAEFKAMLPEIKRRLGKHGLSHVSISSTFIHEAIADQAAIDALP